jgi:hypothetical protein
LPRITIWLVININSSKGQGFRKGQKGKGVVNTELTTKPTQGHPNTMDIRFAQMEALVASMAAHMKSTTSGLGEAKDKKDDQSYDSDVDI